jgi:hypothetical protein
MKRTELLNLAMIALVALAPTAWAGPYGGGGGGHFGGSGFSGGHVGSGHFGSFNGGGIRAAPTFSGGGAHFIGNRSMVGINRAPHEFYYYSGARTSAVVPRASVRQVPIRIMNSTGGRVTTLNHQSNRVNSTTIEQKRVTNLRPSTAENRGSFVKNHAFARHDGSWHRDWDRRHAHFDHGRVFVFVGNSWWGLYPWDYYPYFAYNSYPYDYSYDYDGYPYEGYDSYGSSPYSYYNGYAPSGEYSDTVVSAVQSKLASLGYYNGVIDGVLGDESQAALARYQQDQDLSVTGTVTADTLRALGLSYSGS